MLYNSLISLGSITTLYIFYILFKLTFINILKVLILYAIFTYILPYKFTHLILKCIKIIILTIGIIHHLYYLYIKKYYILLLLIKLCILHFIIDKIILYTFNISSNYIFTYNIIFIIHIYIFLVL